MTLRDADGRNLSPNEDAIRRAFDSDRWRELVRRDPDAPLCEVTWMIGEQPHGCALSPDHDGDHWCTCEATHA